MTHNHVTPVTGESRPFHFESTWPLTTDVEQVWDILADIDSWGQWWPAVKSTDVMHRGTPDAEGRCARVEMASPLGYTLRFTITITYVNKPNLARIEVSGDLRGEGTWWTLSDGARTDLKIVWCVVTRRRLVRLFRPAAAWAHERVMRAGLRGLLLGTVGKGASPRE